MADTIRQQIVNAVMARLSTIIVSNGYETDAGNKLFLYRETPVDPVTEVPCILVRETEDVEPLGFQAELHVLNFEFECTAVNIDQGDSGDAQCRKIKSDIIKAFATDLTFGGLVDDVLIDRRDIAAVEHTDKKLTSMKLEMQMEYESAVYTEY